MRNPFRSVAISAVVAICSSPAAFGGDTSTITSDSVVVEKVSERRFRLVNNSKETLTYMQWLNKEAYPVAHCKYANEKVSICSRERYTDRRGQPALEEAYLKPGKSIAFDATKGDAVAVGVLLRIGRDERIVWHEL